MTDETQMCAMPSGDEVRDFVREQMSGREPEVSCDAALEEGWNLSTCLHPRGTAQLIACIANRLEGAGTGSSEAWRTAWKTAEKQCEDLGFRLEDMTTSLTSGQCDEVWQQVDDLDLVEMAMRNATISEQENKEVGNRVCSMGAGQPSIGTEKGLAMASCEGEELADHHHHTSAGGGVGKFSLLDVVSMIGRDLDVSCITYPDGDDTVMECADVNSVPASQAEVLQEAWESYYSGGDMDSLNDVYQEIEDARDSLQTCRAQIKEVDKEPQSIKSMPDVGWDTDGNGAVEGTIMEPEMELDMDMPIVGQMTEEEFASQGLGAADSRAYAEGTQDAADKWENNWEDFWEDNADAYFDADACSDGDDPVENARCAVEALMDVDSR